MEKEKRLIDANALKQKAVPHYFDNCCYAVSVKDIDDAPSVDAVEVVHGHWIDRTSVKGQVYCSECATIEKSTDSNYKSKHCPNCGAKMDGDANG